MANRDTERIRDMQDCKYGRELCKNLGVDYAKVLKYRNRRTKGNRLSWKECIEYIKNRKCHKITDMAKELGVKSGTLKQFLLSHKELSFDDAIELYKERNRKNRQGKNFRVLCDKLGINYNSAKVYRFYHKELTDLEVIKHYRPFVVRNIFGEPIMEG